MDGEGDEDNSDLIILKLRTESRELKLWFNSSQTEDLGDDAVKASRYGINTGTVQVPNEQEEED